jgi:large subunit ribosomal protein L29
MKVEKIREMSEEEVATQLRESAEQVFRLRFQIATGQTESLNKLRSLKKDIARLKTISRERELKTANEK